MTGLQVAVLKLWRGFKLWGSASFQNPLNHTPLAWPICSPIFPGPDHIRGISFKTLISTLHLPNHRAFAELSYSSRPAGRRIASATSAPVPNPFTPTLAKNSSRDTTRVRFCEFARGKFEMGVIA